MGENFFDFQQRIKRRPTPAAASPANQQPLTVGQLTRQIDKAIKSNLPAVLLVQGEISNYKHHEASGNIYFTLKDTDACIDCVMFRSDRQELKFVPSDGMEMIATGRVGIYPQRGRYQFYVTQLQPLGVGSLELAFKQLHARLQAEGLFASERKKTIPRFPSRLALLTSTGTAALQDMLKVLDRFRFLKIGIFHVPVQGDGAAEKIADAIDCLNSCSGIDVILLSRGGGSLEDLWEFNEECVARAIYNSRIPIITGIGHEIDVCIADLVADYHAHTPTEAAQVVSMHWRAAPQFLESTLSRIAHSARGLMEACRHRLNSAERHEFFRRPIEGINLLRQLLDDRQRELAARVHRRVASANQRLSKLAIRAMEKHPVHRLNLENQRVASLSDRLVFSMRCDFQRRRQRLDAMAAHLTAIAPEQVLRRGFTITTLKSTGKIIRQVDQVRPGSRLITRLSVGQIESTATDANQPELFE